MADMVADKKKKKQGADMELDIVADMEVDMADIDIDIDIDMEIQFGERSRGWLIGPKLFRLKLFLACAFSKLCKFIRHILSVF